MADLHATIPASREQPLGLDDTHRLAIQLADAIVSRAYAPLIWSTYRRRFLEVLMSTATEATYRSLGPCK